MLIGGQGQTWPELLHYPRIMIASAAISFKVGMRMMKRPPNGWLGLERKGEGISCSWQSTHNS